MNQMKYLIVSAENNCVYTFTPRVLTANALTQSHGDSYIRGITTANCNYWGKVTDRDMFNSKIYLSEPGSGRLEEMDESKVSKTWKTTREILRIRQDMFFNWETHTFNALSRVHRHAWDHFDQTAELEIAKCDPKTEQYSWLLEEYARTVNAPVEKVYKELKLRIESDNVTRFRIQALAEKWRLEISRVVSREQAAEVNAGMRREFWSNSLI